MLHSLYLQDCYATDTNVDYFIRITFLFQLHFTRKTIYAIPYITGLTEPYIHLLCLRNYNTFTEWRKLHTKIL